MCQVIVIHPGSNTLRIGRASDINPVAITHAVAVKRNAGAKQRRDSFLPPSKFMAPNEVKELEDSRLRMSHVLQSSVQSNGNRRYATPPQQLAAFNRRTSPEVVPDLSSDDWLPGNLETVVGDDIFRINPAADYNIHFPIRRGQLNVYPGVGGSIFNVLDDLQTIWEYAISEKLNIPLKDIPTFKAVLVVPDIYNKSHLKELTNLLLNRLSFDSCFLVQDHVAGLFGSGLNCACVVDVGAEKTSVSCVEDGISHPNTRVCMEYGGSDITQLFMWLLQKCCFPYKDCSLEDPLDVMLVNVLKEKCHLNLDICGAQEHTFVVMKPNQPVMEYTIQFGDELLITPMALFHTELLNLTGPKLVRTQASYKSVWDAEDCFGVDYLGEIGLTRRGTKEQEQANETIALHDNGDEDLVDNMDNEKDVLSREKDFFSAGQTMGLDLAILQSIQRCPTEEMRRKMFSSILIVGGSVKFPGIEKWLHNRLATQIPAMYKTDKESVLTSSVKEIDPAMTTWKGAAIMSCLESAAELWITQDLWDKQGVKVLREKAPFAW